MDILVQSSVAQHHAFISPLGIHAETRIIFIGLGSVEAVEHKRFVGPNFVFKGLVLERILGVATTASQQERNECHEDDRGENNTEYAGCGQALVFVGGTFVVHFFNEAIVAITSVTITTVTITTVAVLASAILIAIRRTNRVPATDGSDNDCGARVEGFRDALQVANLVAVLDEPVVELGAQLTFICISSVVDVGVDVRVRASVTVGLCVRSTGGKE